MLMKSITANEREITRREVARNIFRWRKKKSRQPLVDCHWLIYALNRELKHFGVPGINNVVESNSFRCILFRGECISSVVLAARNGT